VLGYGHYVAMCLNRYTNGWYLFDDTRCTPVADEADVVSPHAYILFYRRRGAAAPESAAVAADVAVAEPAGVEQPVDEPAPAPASAPAPAVEPGAVVEETAQSLEPAVVLTASPLAEASVAAHRVKRVDHDAKSLNF
jgi:hypothetical protein